jgi:3-ketosteroid 9alpha-monooxygenase subunit B
MAADFQDLLVSGIVQETHDTRSFMFEIPAPLREAFRYTAGQFLTFEVPFEGMQLRRCYSLASSPEADAWHKVTVKRVDGGRISNWFNDQLVVGSKIRVQPPEGRFVLHAEGSDRPLTLFGGGSGITPVISLMKSALLTTSRDVLLVYANRDARSVIFQEELDLLERRYPGRAKVVHHLDAEGGFMTAAKVSGLIAERKGSDFYVCGPGPFMDTVEAGFEAAGIAREQTHFERFVSPTDPDRREATPDAPPMAAGDAPASFTMKLDNARIDVPYVPGETLLKSAEAAGHRPPSSCEDGYCGCCMARLVSGKVTMKSREALTDDDLERGWVLACQARPASSEPIEIDFDAQY